MTISRGQARHLRALQAELGEGPVWDARRALLWLVDISGPAIHSLDPKSGEQRRWPAPAKIGWVLPTDGAALIAGLADGLYSFLPADGSFSLIKRVEPGLPGNRLNDAVRGPDGHIWFGTMDDSEREPSGRFYRFDGRLVIDCAIAPMTITNGPAITPDGRTLYCVDTLAREIWSYSVARGGRLEGGRLFASLASGDGYPDGVTCDAEGGVWLGVWGGACARRYDRSGTLTDEIGFPVANVTKIALGGDDGHTAFATTARQGLSVADLAKQTLAGDLFTFDVAVPAA